MNTLDHVCCGVYEAQLEPSTFSSSLEATLRRLNWEENKFRFEGGGSTSAHQCHNSAGTLGPLDHAFQILAAWKSSYADATKLTIDKEPFANFCNRQTKGDKKWPFQV